jgi:cytochrome c oxidase subunit 2
MLGMLNILADVGGTALLPPSASSYAGDVDWLQGFILWICIIFFALVLVLLVSFCWLYRYREGVEQGPAPKHSTALELTWTFVPTVILVIIFVFGFKGFLRMSIPPPNPYEIVVQGRTWAWSFLYPNGHIDETLHVPPGVPVQYVLTSTDVIHGFYVPAFRVKKDVVPGRYNKMWAQADLPGTYDIYCTQYCGDQHSQMRSTVTVEPTRAAYDEWLRKATALDYAGPPAEVGARLYRTRGCMQCHTLDGTHSTGPSWKNVFGYPVNFADGTSEIADENYIRSMIVNPNNKIVAGFQPVMPSFQGILKEQDITDLIEFIKTKSDKYVASSQPSTESTTAPAAAPTTK